ncbi:primosomal protein N' [Sphingopyxis sp. MWB1]|uniref:primosomal protein N' n=1 Tax=Sphingopyxis sp. MWB1 TaxID=1537715 RepID=UPI00051A2859|nr:primosomal protein N' [Sphingopyxis sp. MWB1]
MTRARVLLLNAALGPLDYRVPEGEAAPLGSVVIAPLGPRRLGGVVWEDESFGAPDPVGDNRLRSLYEIVAIPPVPAPLRRLVEWTSDYYLAPPGAVLRMVLPGVAFADARRPIVEYRATGELPKRMTPQRTVAMEMIGDRQGTVRELSALAKVSEAVIRGLVQTGALEAVSVAADAPYPAPDPGFAPPDLSEEQTAAAQTLRDAVAARKFETLLLDGVTGSGKTEVYMEAVAEAVRAGRQVLILLPEIALTEPMLTRFAARFGCEPVAWHSGLRQAERRRAWHAIARGEAKIVVGARSALFLPYANLGAIIVDEAHETSFKQEDGVHYHARDVAVMRGSFEGLPVILASATPALESLAMVEAGRYRHIALPARYGGARLPDLAAIDMRADPPDRGHWLAPPLVEALADRLQKGEQSLLFLNRRGFAPLTLCRTCGHRIQCPNCTAWMVEHRLVHRLACHHCGHVMPPPRLCPECEDEDSLVACGPGVERVADEVKLRFPDARTAIVTSDTLWSPAKAAEFIDNVEGGLVDIIIGTQLVTKGYHFPNLTLVGVVDADLGLDGGDLRASERTFQQIAQVAGRAGRGAKPGEVLIQTRVPDAPVMAALVANDRDGFYAAEAAARKTAGAPPYGRFAALIISSEEMEVARGVAQRLGQKAPVLDGLSIYGPAPAPLAMLRGRHRFRLLLHAPRSFDLQGAIRDWVGSIDWPAKARLAIDIDPYSFV